MVISIIFYNFLIIYKTYLSNTKSTCNFKDKTTPKEPFGWAHYTQQSNSILIPYQQLPMETVWPTAIAHPHAKKLVCSHGLLLKLPSSANPCRRTGNTPTYPSQSSTNEPHRKLTLPTIYTDSWSYRKAFQNIQRHN